MNNLQPKEQQIEEALERLADAIRMRGRENYLELRHRITLLYFRLFGDIMMPPLKSIAAMLFLQFFL